MASNKSFLSDSSDEEVAMNTPRFLVGNRKKKLKYNSAIANTTPQTSTTEDVNQFTPPLPLMSDVSFEKSTAKKVSLSDATVVPSSLAASNEDEDSDDYHSDGDDIALTSDVDKNLLNKDENDTKKMLKLLLKQNQEILDRLDKLEEKANVSRKEEVLVPNNVRYHVRLAYDNGPKQNIPKWKVETGLGPFHEVNLKMTKYIRNFVNGLNPNLDNRDAVVNKAIKTYFTSQLRQKLRKASDPDRNKNTNRKQRRIHKSKRRQKALQQVSDSLISPAEKGNFANALVPDMMSSEEEMENEDGERYFKVHKPNWRSRKFEKLITAVDKAHIDNASKRAKEQITPRVDGSPSKRLPPKTLKYGYHLFVEKNL